MTKPAAASSPAARPISRPLSPHLQIWRFTVTMAASITHRATGVALYSGTILLAAWALSVSLGEAAYSHVAPVIGSPIGLIVLTGYAWALLFHFLNGVRHLYWDTGRGLAPKTATATAWAIYIGSGLGALAVVAAGVAARGA